MLEKSPKDAEMSDPAVAFAILDDTFGPIKVVGRSRLIARAIEALEELERSLSPEVRRGRKRKWTERRVRSIVDGEAARIDHYEISDLERVRIQEARNELARSRSRAARMAAFLTAQDEDFHRDEIERMGAFARGVDMPGMVRGGAGRKDD